MLVFVTFSWFDWSAKCFSDFEGIVNKPDQDEVSLIQLFSGNAKYILNSYNKTYKNFLKRDQDNYPANCQFFSGHEEFS